MSKLRERIDEIVKPGDLFSELPTEQRIYNKGYADGYCEGLKNKWIPVSEKLPDIYEDIDNQFIILFDNGEVARAYANVVEDDRFAFGDYELILDQDSLGVIDEEFMEYQEVVAWMPMPEYEGGE